MFKEDINEEELQKVFELYQLRPTYLEPISDVIKVYDRQGVYALKRVSTDGNARNQLLTSMQLLYQKGYRHVLPMYHTTDGRYLVHDEKYLYYLLPWVDDIFSKSERDDHYHNMFRSLGKMHKKTQQSVEIDEEQIQDHYDNIKERWENDQQTLESYADECEQRWYMSPFELQYCSSVHQLLRAHSFAKTQLDQWYEQMKEKEKTRVCLIHGNLSIRHYVIDAQDNGYFISFERSNMASPIQDLVSFYTRSFHTYPVVRDDRFQWLQTYNKENPLSKEEKTLLLSYVAYPQTLINQVLAYRNKARDWNEAEYCKRVQKSIWLMNNMEYFISRIREQEAKEEMASE